MVTSNCIPLFLSSLKHSYFAIRKQNLVIINLDTNQILKYATTKDDLAKHQIKDLQLESRDLAEDIYSTESKPD